MVQHQFKKSYSFSFYCVALNDFLYSLAEFINTWISWMEWFFLFVFFLLLLPYSFLESEHLYVLCFGLKFVDFWILSTLKCSRNWFLGISSERMQTTNNNNSKFLLSFFANMMPGYINLQLSKKNSKTGLNWPTEIIIILRRWW